MSALRSPAAAATIDEPSLLSVASVASHSILTGAAVGCALGGGFHIVAGGALLLSGRRTSLTPALVASQSVGAAARLAAVFASYTALRGLLRGTLYSLGAPRVDAVASAVAGGAVVSAATLMSPARRALLETSFARAVESAQGATARGGAPGRAALPAHILAAAAAVSGALTLGGADLLILKPLGLRW
jgi:hypothetical protein